MLRHFCILCVAACSLWTAVIGLLLVACNGGGSGGGKESEQTVKLFWGKLQVPMFDSISVDISADDMASIHISKKSLEDNLKIEGIPQGENRKFEVKIYADSGILVQKGEAVTDIIADESITVPITLKALFGFLKLEIPLGFTNSTGVHSGQLFLEGMVFDMKFENGKGVFNTGALSLNNELYLKIKLYGYDGEILFEGEKEITLHLVSQSETIQLRSTKGTAIMELTASAEGPTQILAMLPASVYGKKTPQNYGALFFTEIYADPKTNGDEFEYLEIYNATTDTLELSRCRIARDRSTTANTYRLDMPHDLTLPPMKFLFFGRDSVENAHFKYKGLTLVNGGQSLGIFCDNIVIDSIYYSNNAENKFPLTRGKAMQLPLKNYETRALGSSWCLGFSPGEDAICP